MRIQLYFDALTMLSILNPRSFIERPWEMRKPSFSMEFIILPFPDVETSITVLNFTDSFDDIILPLAFISINPNSIILLRHPPNIQ